jgi:hypothetical protein
MSMRTSMRPSSGGSRRISKRLLPFLTEAAISRARPLNGTGPFVAAVTLKAPPGDVVGVVEAGCDCSAATVWAPGLDESVRTCAEFSIPGCSCAETGEAAAVLPSTAVGSLAPAISVLPADGVCCRRLFWETPAGFVADASAAELSSVVVDEDDVVAEVAFGVACTVAATAPFKATASVADELIWRACAITGEALAAFEASEVTILTPGADDALVIGAGAVVGPLSESPLP